MLIKRDNMDALSHMNLSDAKVLCLCPICGELSDILNSDALLDEVVCPDTDCNATMEVLLVSILDE